MSKTAEEILIENAYISESDMVHEESKHVFKAMREFAAQEVDSYKERLKEFISAQVHINSSLQRLTEAEIQCMINAVK